jgi:hypothetical protein
VLERYLADLQEGHAPPREELLASHPDLATQLEACLAGIEFIHRTAQPPDGTPQRLGDFRIVREIGRGGMGVVYEAEQLSLKRRVALKVLRFGVADDPEAQRRFHREAETVGRLHHTNIVPVFAVGCERGVHYYAMEYIEGRTLACVLEEAARESRPLDVSDVARWGLAAAQALAHAHERSVIHRDIKPSNLLLDGDGRLWLTDFGLARTALDMTLTSSGALLGTPRYMSPEQASGSPSLDPRSDLFSLGVTLYELATGRPAFEASTPHEVITRILTEEPARPRRLRPTLPADFETICLKCLYKEPGRRYASAADLAEDLRRFLAGEAIRARRLPPWERAWRWAKRRPAGASLLAVSVLSLIAFVTGLAWHAHTLNEERLRAEAHLHKAREAVDDLLQVAKSDLINQPHLEQLRKRLLERAARIYEELLQEEARDPAVRFEAARVTASLANISWNLGKADEAATRYARAVMLLRGLHAEDAANPDYRFELARCLDEQAYAFQLSERLQEAEDQSREAQRILLELVLEYPNHRDYRAALAQSYYGLGILLTERNRAVDAERCYEQALELREALVQQFPQEAKYRHVLAMTLNNWAGLLSLTNRPDPARTATQRAIDLLRELVRQDPAEATYRRDLANCCNDLAAILDQLNRFEEAERASREALRWNEELARQFSAFPRYRFQLATNHYGLARILKAAHKPAEAHKHFDEAVTLLTQIGSEYPCRYWLAGTLLDRGLLRFDQADTREAAVADLDRCAGLLEQLLQDSSPTTDGQSRPELSSRPRRHSSQSWLATAQTYRGLHFAETRRPQEAEQALRQALALWQSLAAEMPKDYRQYVTYTQEQLAKLPSKPKNAGKPDK